MGRVVGSKATKKSRMGIKEARKDLIGLRHSAPANKLSSVISRTRKARNPIETRMKRRKK